MAMMKYELLEATYEDLTRILDDMVEQEKNAKDIINKMDNSDHWDGNGYDSFNKKFNAIASNFGAYCNEMYKLNNNIKSSIERYKAIDEQVTFSITSGFK